METKKNSRGCLFAFAIVLFVFLGFAICNQEEQADPLTEAKNKKVEFVRASVCKYLKSNLKDPKSYDDIEWSQIVDKNDGKYIVRHKYRAKNSFGGYVIENKVFIIDSSSGEIKQVVDYLEN